MLLSLIRHPEFETSVTEWFKWRTTYEGGRLFIQQYLRKLSTREEQSDFEDRKAVTYCPAFAKVAVNEVKDSIYQRMTDITRAGGTKNYQNAVNGLNGGVDLLGSSMNYFMGCKVLPELLTMRKVGIYVDMPPLMGESLANNVGLKPYIYFYKAEEILSWVCDETSDQNDFTAILLEENVYTYDEETGFPTGMELRYRKIWQDESGLVWVCFYNKKDEMVDQFGNPAFEPIPLNINRLPFVVLEISESLLTDIADYQIALLNLASTDMSYALKSNYPFYTEQRDNRATSPHLRPVGEDGTTAEANTGKDQEIKVGVSRGRSYAINAERPGFIHPSSEPLLASMQKQEQLKSEIRLLIKLTISNLKGPKMASAESKQEDSRSLETGLSYIGLELENAERKIAELWTLYEGETEVATVNYPENYSLRTEDDRRAEAVELQNNLVKIPSLTYQKAMGKRIARILLGPKVSKEIMAKIEKEIDAVVVMNNDYLTMQVDVETGLVSLDLASQIRGYPAGEAEKAKADHAERLKRIAESQSIGQVASAARGLAIADPNGKQSATDEKKQSRDTTADGTVIDKTRGQGKKQ